MTESGPERIFGKVDAISDGKLVPSERVDCPVCGIEPEPFAVDYQGFNLCRCPKCGLEFVNPRLNYKQLADNVYSDNYFPDEDDSMIIPPERSHYFRRQLDNFKKLMPEQGRLLDLGCGNCEFLDAARSDGWEIAGVDIKLTPRARRFDCAKWQGPLEEIEFAGETFDLIRLNHVLEHMQNPVASLKRLRPLLRPNGILFISVPNIAGISLRAKNFQSRFNLKSHKWRHYAAVHHLFFFTNKTLELVLEKAGYRVLGWSTPESMRAGQGSFSYRMARVVKETTRTSSILDFYSTPA